MLMPGTRNIVSIPEFQLKLVSQYTGTKEKRCELYCAFVLEMGRAKGSLGQQNLANYSGKETQTLPEPYPIQPSCITS